MGLFSSYSLDFSDQCNNVVNNTGYNFDPGHVIISYGNYNYFPVLWSRNWGEKEKKIIQPGDHMLID